jgi:PA domain
MKERANMSKEISTKLGALALSLMLGVMASGQAAADATIVIVNLDGPGEGFNDPTRARPIGGNKGKTLGEQRLIAFQHAAAIWGQTLDSNVTIRIQAAFNPLGPGVLGSAGAISVSRDFSGIGNFPGAEFPATWYGAALANKRAGLDLEPSSNDINAQFSSNFNFYLGLDNDHGALPDLVAVLLHEFGHGLNFQTFYNRSNGAGFQGHTDIYARYLFDRTFGLTWPNMTNSQVAASAINFGNLVWSGDTVTDAVPVVLFPGNPQVDVLSPPAIARTYQFGTAAFGPPVGNPNVTAPVVAAQDAADAAGPTTTDGCSAFTNAAAIDDKIALVERGGCGFALKARNATEAGASAVMIYNQAANAAAAPPGMADDGINGQFVTIPAVSLTRADGLGIVGQLGAGVTARLIVDPNVRAGADPEGRARMYAPNPLVGGSSVSHYDSVASRNLLMEPSINPDLTHEVSAPNDLTHELFLDLGWFPDSDLDGVANALDSAVNSNFASTIVIGGINTGVPNRLLDDGRTMSDAIADAAAAARNQREFVGAVSKLAGGWRQESLTTQAQTNAIVSAAAGSKSR